MKKKGFTLVELLATIVVLSVIALIAITIVINVIEKAKKSALVSSVNGLVESANMYYANQSIKGEQMTETIFDFANGEQTSTSKLSYKGKVYNGKLILHANGEVAVCIDDREHYAYKNKDTDEVVSGTGTCVYDGTTGDFSSNSSINDLRGKTVVATNITQSVYGLSTLITIPKEGHYDINSIISIQNSQIKTPTLIRVLYDNSIYAQMSVGTNTLIFDVQGFNKVNLSTSAMDSNVIIQGSNDDVTYTDIKKWGAVTLTNEEIEFTGYRYIAIKTRCDLSNSSVIINSWN